jgi:hypothetical protein
MVHRTLASLMLLGTLVACAPVGQGGYYAGGPAYYGSGAPLYAGGYGRGSATLRATWRRPMADGAAATDRAS